MASPAVTDLIEVYSSNEDVNRKHHDESNISKDIQKCNDKEMAYSQIGEENVEENLRDVCDVILSNGERSYHKREKLENNELSSILVDKIHLSNRLDLDRSSKENKKSFIVNNEYHSGSVECLQIAKHKNNSKNKNLRRMIDSESKEDIQTSDSNNFSQKIPDINTTAGSYQALIDSESEEEKQNDEIENNFLIASEETFKNKDVKKKSVKRRKDSIRASKDEAMRQIHSETQRLLRETEISLPYHKPKQRTLQEFLNRKKISAALPKAPSIAAKLKMSSVIVSQVLAEKEKDAEFFYKSSDSEDDMQQSISLVSKDIKNSSITNDRKKVPSTDMNYACIQDPRNIETNAQNSHKRGIVQKDHLDLNAHTCQVLLEKDFCNIDHQDVELSSLTENNSNLDNGFDTLRQIPNKYKQNLLKLSLQRKLFDTCFEKETNDISEGSHGEQEATKEVVETIITSLNKKKYINDEKKSKTTMTENHILEISNHQYDSKVTSGDKDENSIIEAMKVSETSSNNINNKEIDETLKKNDVSDNVITYSDNCIIIQDRNNEEKDKYSKTSDISLPSSVLINDSQSQIQDNSSTDEYEKSDGHVQGLPLPKFANETSSNRKISTLVSNSKVTLKGSPGMIIDLTDDAKSNAKGINTLLDRFFCKHINTKKQVDNKSEITVVQDTQNSILPIKEVPPYKVPVNIDNSELNKPGTKLMRLKEDLKLQMILKRNKEWKQKEIEFQAERKEKWDEEEESDYDLNGQEETELGSELSDKSEESEPEEEDICIKDKKRSKYLFADDEAEVTDNEGSSTSIEEAYDKYDINQVKHSKQSTSFKYRKEYMNRNVNEIETDQEEEENEDEEGRNKERLDANIDFKKNKSDFKGNDDVNVCKSIAKIKNNREKNQLIEENDSNVTNSYLPNHNNQLNIAIDIDTYKTHCEDNDWISENESNMPAYQQCLFNNAEIITRSQICKTPLTKTSMLDSVSPITQLSVLNTTLDSNKKNSLEKRECLIDKHESVSMESTQSYDSSEHTCNVRNKTVSKKKLFDDIGDTVDNEYLMRLCSGKFECTQKTDLDLFSQSNTTELQLRPSESKLCPGNSNTELDVKQSEKPEVNNKMLQDIKSILDEDSNNLINYARKIKKASAVGSELKLRVASSDDEDNEDIFVKPKKRSIKRLKLSDSEEENIQSSDEEIDDIDNNREEAEEQYVDYDSEENEIVVIPEKDIKEVAAGFLEEEAELSESDWDSADEDEKDLDKLEFEEADDEDIDEHEVKSQLEKIHMKQILVEDKKEVRLLKELLFEDGDLHTDGMGRERKFKWRNIDKLGNNIEMPQISDKNDGWVDVQEDEEEAKWSKLRHERDKFMEERMKCSNNEIEDELCDSQIFKFGLKAVRKIKDDESQRQDISDKVDSSENMEPIMPRNITDLLNGPNIGKKSQMIYNVIKKRSLLTRGEESLAKIALLAKQGDSASHTVNTRNFVFQYIDESTDNTSKKEKKTTEDLDSQIKPRKRKMSSISSKLKKRRK